MLTSAKSGVQSHCRLLHILHVPSSLHILHICVMHIICIFKFSHISDKETNLVGWCKKYAYHLHIHAYLSIFILCHTLHI